MHVAVQHDADGVDDLLARVLDDGLGRGSRAGDGDLVAAEDVAHRALPTDLAIVVCVDRAPLTSVVMVTSTLLPVWQAPTVADLHQPQSEATGPIGRRWLPL